MEHFAKDSKADLITLTLDDLRDLAAHFAVIQGVQSDGLATVAASEPIMRYFNRVPVGPYYNYGMPGEQETMVSLFVHAVWLPSTDIKVQPAFPFKAITSRSVKTPLTPVIEDDGPCPKSTTEDYESPTGAATKEKMAVGTRTEAERRPLVVHMPKTQELLKELGSEILNKLREEIERLGRENPDVVVIFTSPEYTRPEIWSESVVVSTAGNRAMKAPIMIAPFQSAPQVALFMEHQAAEKSFESTNVRRIQYTIRAARNHALDVPLLTPYASWGFLTELEGSERISENKLEPGEIEKLIHAIGKTYDPVHIRSCFLAVDQRKKLHEQWWPSIQTKYDAKNKNHAAAKWSTYPAHFKDAI